MPSSLSAINYHHHVAAVTAYTGSSGWMSRRVKHTIYSEPSATTQTDRQIESLRDYVPEFLFAWTALMGIPDAIEMTSLLRQREVYF